MMQWWGGQYGMGFGFGGIFMILFWVLIIIGLIYLIKIFAGGNFSSKEKMETAEEVLEKRFARGEISKEEFEEKTKIIN